MQHILGECVISVRLWKIFRISQDPHFGFESEWHKAPGWEHLTWSHTLTFTNEMEPQQRCSWDGTKEPGRSALCGPWQPARGRRAFAHRVGSTAGVGSSCLMVAIACPTTSTSISTALNKLRNNELHFSNGWILWYVDYISIKPYVYMHTYIWIKWAISNFPCFEGIYTPNEQCPLKAMMCSSAAVCEAGT